MPAGLSWPAMLRGLRPCWQAEGGEPAQAPEELDRPEEAVSGLGEAPDEQQGPLERLRETLGGTP